MNRRTSSFAAAALVLTLALQGVPGSALAASAPRKPASPPAAPEVPSVSGVRALPMNFAKAPDAAASNYAPKAVKWPAATEKSLPGTVPARMRILDHSVATALGVQGVVFTVAGTSAGSGKVTAELDYSGFAEAVGGNYGSRLRLYRLPACALTTPQVASCRQGTPLASTNDTARKTLSAGVQVTGVQTSIAASQPVVLAAQSEPGSQGGSAGSYAATELKPAGTWAGGGSTGSFTYNYPIGTPPSTTGSTVSPKLALNYDSGSVDGQTASTQAQASWVGNGWTIGRSYIEQSFVSCEDDPGGTASPVKTTDLCYNGPILTLSLNGSSTALIWDATKSVWKAQSDDGSVITRVTNSSNGSGTYNTDYWTVTTPDGTVYSFGRNQIPGWTSGKTATSSVDYEPVYSSHSGDPCYEISGSGFNNSVCTMAYRWNLDYVKDVRGGAMAYYYKQDFNYYGRNKGATDVKYVRDSYLDHIDYGFTDGNAYGTVPNKVLFGTGPRCVTAPCTPLNDTTKANWLDVPYDLVCNQGTDCNVWAPTFFSTVALTSVTSQQWNTGTSQYDDVDRFALAYTMPPTGDGTAPTLWLSSITRTGVAGTGAAITLPPLQFGSVSLPNRVDTVTDGLPAMQKHRLASITTESGSVITIGYGEPNPCTAPVTLDAATNTSSCYPVRWTPAGMADAITDWFQKYVVTSVTATDPTGGSVPSSTSYSYLGGAAWHYDDNEVVKAKYRSYGQFRGYAMVRTYTGDVNNDPRTLSETAYYRGMSKNNSSTVVNVTDSLGGVHEDIDQLSGRELETTSYLGDGGPIDHSTISHYWVSGATATRSRTGLAALDATNTAVAQTLTRQALTAVAGTTTWQYTQTDNSYDASITSSTFGLLQRTYTHTVPADTAYDQCTSLQYAPVNPTSKIVGLVAEKEIVSVKCGGFTQGSPISVPAALNSLTAPTADRPAQVVSVERTFYDDAGWSTTFPQTTGPLKGDITMTRKAVDYTGGAYTWQTTARSTYDGYGRALEAYDGNGNITSTTYTTNAVGLTTGTDIRNALSQTSKTTFDTRRGLPLTQTDANNITVTEQYDTMGRLLNVWTQSRPTTDPANYKFTYVVANNGVSYTRTERLGELLTYNNTSVTLYDALLRKRQTQTATPQSGRLVTDTFYDSRGWKKASYSGWWDPANLPTGTAVASATDLGRQVPDQDFFTYDGLGRAVYDVKAKNGAPISTTTTVYNGDRTTTIAPDGGIYATSYTDPLGRIKRLDQYKANPTVNTPANTFTGVFTISGGTPITTTYGFDGHGKQNSVTTTTGTWTTTYDLLGQAVAKSDPDAGATSNIRYDGNGNVTEITDSRTQTVSYTYDALNRKTGQYASTVAAQVPYGQPASNQLARWVYDNSDNAVPGMTNPIGQQTGSAAYWNAAAYTKQERGFDLFGNSLGTTVTIPSAEGSVLGSSFTVNRTYSTNTGLLLQDKYPLKWGLPLETVNHGYGVLDMPATVGGLSGYQANTTYDAYRRVNQSAIGSSPNLAYVTNTYDEHTGLLKNRLVTRAVGTPTNVDEQAYERDLSGNIIKQVSTRLGSASTSETQCYRYDTLNRLTSAWTATDDCAVTPTTGNRSMVGSNLGASSRYWTSWTLSDTGNRTQQTDWATAASGDVTTGYTYNGNGTGQADTLTATANSGASTATTSYTYDAAGNMQTRTAGLGNQILNWDAAGRLTSITGGTAGPSTFLYDADGELLLQKDPGFTTLYLPGQQVTLNTTTNTTTGVRSYPLPGGATALRTGSGTNYKFALSDIHDTAELLLDNTAQTPAWRQFTLYGAPRGAAVSWPDNRGFLNKPTDTSTGLTVVGARSYDPVTARFASVDPEFHGEQPQSLNSYSYANNNPLSYSDPTGRAWGFLKVVAAVASVASIIPGPIGMIASGVAAVSYAAVGDYKNAAIAAAGIALAAVGAGAAVIAVRAARAGEAIKDGVQAAQAVEKVVDTAVKAEKAVDAAADAGKAGDVLLDTNAVFKFSKAEKLLRPGERPVISETVVQEVADVAGRAGSKFTGAIPRILGRIADDTSIGNRMRALWYLRGARAAEQGINGDAAVVATALARNIPVITGDRAVYSVVRWLGGHARWLD